MRRLSLALFAIASLATACVDHSHDYEVITGFDTGPIQDVRSDRPRPDVQDVMDVIEDDAGEFDTGPLSDGGQNGTCAGGDAAACPATPHATVTCESERCIYRCAAGYEDCDGTAANGCEAHTADDTNNCGTCGTTCTGGAPHSTPACVAGSCDIVCATGFGNCDNDRANGCEIDIRIDPSHCGVCTTTCSTIPNATATCTAMACGTMCNTGYANCNSSTADGCETQILDDLANCGMCGRTCTAGAHQTAACAAGVCNTPCDAGFGNCDSMAANGCETTLTDNPMACGSCGNACPSGPNSHAACSGSTCSLVCDSGFENCDGNAANGCEVNLGTSATHCGTCAMTCSGGTNATAVCASSVCGLSCNPGYANCDMANANGCEINTGNDRNNCGMCGHFCMGGTNATATCSSGVCGLVCSTGFFDCDGMLSTGCEINVATSTTNCGTCGTVCPAGANAVATCTTGICGMTCIPPYRNCDGNTANGCEVDASSSPTNCGACGTICPGAPHASPSCTSSTCGFTCDAGFLNCDGMASTGCEYAIPSGGPSTCP